MPLNLTFDQESLPNSPMMTISFGWGEMVLDQNVPILCPNQSPTGENHIFVKNGRDTHFKSPVQQYICRTCGRTFFAHTSLMISTLDQSVKAIFAELLQGGRLTLAALANRFQITKNYASHLLGRILTKVSAYLESNPSFLQQYQASGTLFVDETFLTIQQKTWYLVVGVSGDNHVMGLKLTEHRDEPTLRTFIFDCADRLTEGLQLLATDGLMAYKSVAKEWAIAHQSAVVHVRHIHKPDFHHIELDYYQPSPTLLKINSANFYNDIFVKGGAFIAETKCKEEKLGVQKRGRKAGGHNRSVEEIELEKQRKTQTPKKRGRPKGSTKKTSLFDYEVFVYKQEASCVETLWNSSTAVAAALNIVLKQFSGLYITTNLIEKEFSVLKELLSFRGRRDAMRWVLLLTAYYALREDPDLLDALFATFEFSPTTLLKLRQGLICWEVGP